MMVRTDCSSTRRTGQSLFTFMLKETAVPPRHRTDTPQAASVTITDDTLTVDLLDGRSVSIPLEWYPRLLHAQVAEREHWRLIGNGEGIRWPDLDEDISVEAIVYGIPSREGRQSLRNWLEERKHL